MEFLKERWILGIDTSCDDTSIALVKGGKKVAVNLIASQEQIHKQYQGVYPELAARAHVNAIIPLLEKALKDGGISLEDIGAIAYTKGPGLIGSLLIGIETAKALALALKKPSIAVNHLEAHLYAAFMEDSPLSFPPLHPMLGFVLSGGHTCVVKIEQKGKIVLIGNTVDDAIGEAFDKVAILLGLSYPGGSCIEDLAKEGDPSRFPFKPAKIKKLPWHFSFSGLKTSVLYAIKELQSASTEMSEQDKKDLAASFQRAAFAAVADKIEKAVKEGFGQEVVMGGGVCCNQALRSFLQKKFPQIKFYFALPSLCKDNGAMIAGLAYYIYQRQGSSPFCLGPSVVKNCFE